MSRNRLDYLCIPLGSTDIYSYAQDLQKPVAQLSVRRLAQLNAFLQVIGDVIGIYDFQRCVEYVCTTQAAAIWSAIQKYKTEAAENDD